MPRAKTQIETTGLAGDPRCRRQIREVLAYGRSVLGGPREYGLATRDDWGAAWEKYGDDLAAVYAIERPGLRPVAMYVMRLLPRPRPTATIPADAPGFDIEERDGTTSRFIYHDPVLLGCEARFLFKRGVIAVEEMRAHERSRHHVAVCRQGVAV